MWQSLQTLFRFRKPADMNARVETCMDDADRTVIRRFASGETALREQAITIHRKWMDRIGVRGTIEQDFMAEVDHPCPDFALREHYRRVLVDAMDSGHTPAPLRQIVAHIPT